MKKERLDLSSLNMEELVQEIPPTAAANGASAKAPGPPPETRGETRGPGDAPQVRVVFPTWTEDLATMAKLTWETIDQTNQPPALFRHGGLPSRIERDDDGAPQIRALNPPRLRHHLVRIAEWCRVIPGDDGPQEIRVALPGILLQDLLATPDSPLPILTRIVEAPTFAPDGSLHYSPGYSTASRCYYFPGTEIPPVPQTPENADVVEARRLLLDETLGDFPFVGDAEQAHTVALLLLPFCRELIQGPTPIHLIEKPSPGTGAGLLADVVGLVATGRPVPAMTEGRDEDEWRKRLFAKLRRGPSLLLIDNLRRRLDSAALSSALTAWPSWEDRILGVSEIQTVPVRCTWIATGNNPALSTEIARRTIRIRLDSKVDRPWLRGGFRHPNLHAWVKDNRARLVWALLVLIRFWLSIGRPGHYGPKLGSYDGYSEVLGGILGAAGIKGFLGNLEDLYEAADEDGNAFRAFLAIWHQRFGASEVGVKQLLPLAFEVEDLKLGDGKEERSQRTRLGKLIGQGRDRTFTIGELTLRLEKAGTDKNAALWRLRQARPPDER